MTCTRSFRARKVPRSAVVVGLMLVACTAPAAAGPVPPDSGASATTVVVATTSTTSTLPSTGSSAPASPTTAPVIAWPEPAGSRCGPNWFSGFLLGVESEHGSRPSAVDQEGRSASDVGATLAFEQILVRAGGETQGAITEHRIRITVAGRTHQLTTAPHPAYGHYRNRTPGPFEVEGGTLRFVSDAGRTWVFFHQSTSGAWTTFGWELGACVPARERVTGAAPRAEAQPGSAGYTG